MGTSKLLIQKNLTYAVLLIMVLLFMLASATPVQALGDIFPDPSGTMIDANTVVAKRGGSYQLESDSSAYRIFIPITYSGNVRVAIMDACNNYVYPSTSPDNYRTRFQLFTAPGGEEPISAVSTPTSVFDTANCGDTSNAPPDLVCGSYSQNRCLTINTSSLTRSTVPGHTNYYTLVLKADRVGSGGGINGYRIWVTNPGTGAIVTYRDLYQRDVWDGSGLTEVNAYNRPLSFNSFAMLDQAFPGSGEDGYNLTFAAACDYTPTTAFIKWTDADYNSPPLPNEDGDIYLELINLSTGLPVSLRVYDESGTHRGTDTRVEGDLIGGDGNNSYRAARFDISPYTNYRWQWRNVQDANGIQIWMPFNEINSNITCPSPAYITANSSCDAIRGTYREPDGATQIQARVSYGNGLGAETLTLSVSGGTTALRNYQINIPQRLWHSSGTRIQWVRIVNVGEPGYTWAAGYAPDQVLDCTTEFNNTPLSQSASGYPAAESRVYPGDTIRVITRVRNTGDGNSPLINLRVTSSNTALLQQVGNGSPWDSNDVKNGDSYYRFVNEPGPTAGNSTVWYTTTYQVKDITSTQNDTRVCITGRVSPATGQSTPTVTTTLSARSGNSVCFLIYNLRYDIDDPDPSGPRSGSPGTDVPVNFSYTNVGNGPTPSSPNQIRVEYSDTYIQGSATTVTANNYRPVIPGNNASWNTDDGAGGGILIEIPPNAQVGESYCVRSRARPQNGFSDGSDYDLRRLTSVEEYCVNVSDGPYLQVYGNDVWAGATFGSVCSSSPTASISSIVSSLTPTVGGLAEYSAYARGTINSFDTAFNHDTDPDRLKFANTVTPPGQYEASKCVPDYFAELDTSVPAPDDLNGMISSATDYDGQFYFASVTSFTSNSANASNYSSKLTLLIDGDLTISGNRIGFKPTYSSIADIPSLVFIVRGNINIGPNVTNLDGIYLSYGTINTCDNGADPLAASGALDDCDRPLLVNGALIGQKIQFRRTNGGTNEARTGNLGRCNQIGPYEGSGVIVNEQRCAAELIRFSPEAYLANHNFIRNGGAQTSNKFEIQQLIDLPPVY